VGGPGQQQPSQGLEGPAGQARDARLTAGHDHVVSAAQAHDGVVLDVPIFEVMDAALKAGRRRATVNAAVGLVGPG
jgi:hypothetical protein